MAATGSLAISSGNSRDIRAAEVAGHRIFLTLSIKTPYDLLMDPRGPIQLTEDDDRTPKLQVIDAGAGTERHDHHVRIAGEEPILFLVLLACRL